MATSKLTVLYEEPTMLIQRPSSGSSQDVTHILASTFRDLFTRDFVEQESVWNLDKSRTGDESYHERYVEELKKVQVERERCMAESAMLERHIMQARAKSMAEDEKQLNRAASDCDMYHDLGLPPVESSFSHCLDSLLLRKHGLIIPEDFSTQEPPQSHPPRAGEQPQYSDATESSAMQVLSRDRDHAQVRLDHSLELKMMAGTADNKKVSKREVMKHGSLPPDNRELHRKDLTMVYKKSDFLRNARHRPPTETGGKRSLVKANTVSHKLGGAKTTVIDTSPEDPAVVFVATPAPIVFSKYQVGNVYEATLDVKNVSAASRPLRVIPPKTQNFAVGLGKFPGEQGIIAPGMSCQYNVRFMPDSLMNFNDELKIQTQACEPLIVKLQGKRAPPVLSLSPVIDCGHCLVNGAVTREFIVKNGGGCGRFCVMPRESWPATSFRSVSSGDKTELPPFVIQPAMFELQAGHAISLYVFFSPEEESVFEETITIVCDNCTVKHFIIHGEGQTAGVLLKSVSGGESAPSLGELRDLTAQHHVRFESVNPLTTGTKQLAVQNTTNVELPYYWQCYTPIPVNQEPVIEGSAQRDCHKTDKKGVSTATRQLDGSMVFHVTPDRGILPPGGGIDAALTFSPPAVGSYNSVLHLILENVPDTASAPSPMEGREVTRRHSRPPTAKFVDVTALEVEVRGECEEFNVVVEPYAVIIPGEILVSTTVRKHLMMTNYSQYPAFFSWDTVSDCHIIEVQPNRGQLPGRSTADLEVTLTPGRVGPLDETVLCHIENQPSAISLKVQAYVKGPAVVIDTPSRDFGLIRFGDSSRMEVVIRNESQVAARYQIRESPESSLQNDAEDHSEIRLSRSSGELRPLASESLLVTFTPSVCRKVRSVLECIVEDGTDCFVPVRADVQRPQACLMSSTIALHGAYRGVPTQHTVKLVNQTLLPSIFEWGKPIGPQATSCQVTFDPPRGTLGPHQELDVRVTLTADLVSCIKDFLVPCKVNGMVHPVVLSVEGEVQGLRVTYSIPEQDRDSTLDSLSEGGVEINFGSEVELGSSPSRLFQIENHTAIEAPFNISVEFFTASKPPTPPEGSRKRVSSPKRRGLLAPTTNLADPKSKSSSHLQSEYTKAILRDNRGLAFVVEPAVGTLRPRETLEIKVTTFSDIWGAYRDNLICKIADLEPVVIPVKATIVGCPLKFQMSTLKGQIPVVRFGTHVCGVQGVHRPLKIINNSPCDVRVDWQISNLLEGDPSIVDLVVNIGDPFPILDQTGREIEPAPMDRQTSQSPFLGPEGRGAVDRDYKPTEEDVSSGGDEELGERTGGESGERHKLVSVILKEHEGNLAEGPFSVDRRQLLIPAKSQVGFVTYFTPDVKYLPSLEATDCVGYALGYLTFAEEADKHPSEQVERSERFDVEPLRLDFTANMKPAILKIETSEEEGMVYRTAASRLLQPTADLPHWTLHPSYTPALEATLTNATQTPLTFRLVFPEPFFMARLDPVPKRPGEERQKRRSFQEFEEGEMLTLPSQTNVEISVAFRLTLDLLKSALDDLQPTQEITGGMCLTANGEERKLHISRDLHVSYNNGTTQKLPLYAVVTLPSLMISPDTVDFGTCLVGQERSLEVTVCNITASASVFKAHLCSQEPVDDAGLDVFSIAPSVGYLEPHVTHVSNSEVILKVSFIARHNIPYEGVFMVQGLLGEDVRKIKVTSQGSYDNRHEALVNI